MQSITKGCILIQFLQNTKTVDDIIGEQGSLARYFGKRNLLDLPLVKINFIRSLAAYCVFSHFAQVKDRHNSNILIDE